MSDAPWQSAADALNAYLRTLEAYGVRSDAEATFWRDPHLTPFLSAELARRLLGMRNYVAQYQQRFDTFKMRLLNAFDQVGGTQDGWPHPVEEAIREALEAEPERVRPWLRALVLEQVERSPEGAAELLRCIGCCGRALVGDVGVELVRVALRHPDSSLRDAALRAIECWAEDDPALLAELHPEAEPDSRLAETMRDLIAHAAQPPRG